MSPSLREHITWMRPLFNGNFFLIRQHIVQGIRRLQLALTVERALCQFAGLPEPPPWFDEEEDEEEA